MSIASISGNPAISESVARLNELAKTIIDSKMKISGKIMKVATIQKVQALTSSSVGNNMDITA